MQLLAVRFDGSGNKTKLSLVLLAGWWLLVFVF